MADRQIIDRIVTWFIPEDAVADAPNGAWRARSSSRTSSARSSRSRCGSISFSSRRASTRRFSSWFWAICSFWTLPFLLRATGSMKLVALMSFQCLAGDVAVRRLQLRRVQLAVPALVHGQPAARPVLSLQERRGGAGGLRARHRGVSRADRMGRAAGPDPDRGSAGHRLALDHVGHDLHDLDGALLFAHHRAAIRARDGDRAAARHLDRAGEGPRGRRGDGPGPRALLRQDEP